MTIEVKNVWANGFGRWHTRVVIDDDPGDRILAATEARAAIVAELTVREGPNFDPDVIQVEVTDETYQHGIRTLYFAEKVES